MFSKKFKSDNSLERFEIDDMLSAIKDVQKVNKDIHTKRKRGRPVVKEQQKHDEAVRDLIEAFGEWYNRLYCEAKETTPIQTVTGVEIRSDPQAQHAIRKLYDHLKLRKNPVSMDDETWLAKLVELSKAFTSLLLQPSAPDPYSPETWVPEDWEDLPFQNLDPWLKEQPELSGAPDFGEVPSDEEMAEEDETAAVETWKHCQENDGVKIGKVVSEVLREDDGHVP